MENFLRERKQKREREGEKWIHGWRVESSIRDGLFPSTDPRDSHSPWKPKRNRKGATETFTVKSSTRLEDDSKGEVVQMVVTMADHRMVDQRTGENVVGGRQSVKG